MREEKQASHKQLCKLDFEKFCHGENDKRSGLHAVRNVAMTMCRPIFRVILLGSRISRAALSLAC